MKSPTTPISSLSTSLSSSSFVQIGEGSYSPGDVYLECLLPKVITTNRHLPQSNNAQSKHKLNNSSKHSPASDLRTNHEDDSDVHVVPLSEHFVIQQAQQECRSLLNGNTVSIFEDEDVKEEVVEVLGNEAELLFRTRNIFRYLVLFVKNLDAFFEFSLDVLDDKQKYRHLKVTNAKSLARVEDSSAQLPLAFGDSGATGPGWRYLCMDLQRLTRQAFGTRHVTTTRVRIGGNCRLLRVFFQDELYADAELPAHLTFLG
ncbi:Transcription factor iib [Globisporangium polare]